MRRSGHSWQLVLFVGAILVPTAILIVVSQRTIQQSRELSGKRRADDARAAKERISRELLARLDALGRAAAQNPDGAHDSEVALAARVESGRVLAPWESSPETDRFRETTRQPAFAAAVARGEQAEFAARDTGAAVAGYRQALEAATGAVQSTYARLLLARVLEKQGRTAEAIPEARRILDAPPDVVDDDGVPLRLHAASLLAPYAAERGRVQQCLAATGEAREWYSPVATFTLSAIADQLARAAPAPDQRWLEEFRARIAAAIRLQEQMLALQNDASRLGLLQVRPAGAGSTWTFYPGFEPWLVAAEAGREGATLLVALRARDVFRPFEAAGDLRFQAATEPGGELAGDRLPGLKVVMPASGGDSAGPRPETGLYYAALFLVVGATAFGASMLWRSLGREMQLAQTRSQFVSSVSHELKTPLTSIRMFAETLQMRRFEDPKVEGEYLDTIVNECERLSRLVDDVLLFSKIEQGKKQYRFRPVVLADILSAAARVLSYPLAQHGFDLRMELAEDVLPVKGDPDALEQAVLNLLTNAMKYSGDSRRIDVGLSRRNGEAVIRVTDYGVGMAAEEHARIFEKYYRAPTRENQTIPGTGLGLTLVAQIVKAHGGRVEVESAPGKGSTFQIRLPAGSQS